MGKNKMIAKSCPKCEMQVAVASKSCKCGHTFFASRRAADALTRGDELRRRTARVRRNQPQFYDSQHYQKQKKRSPNKKRDSEDNYKGKDKDSVVIAGARARRRRALRRARRESPGRGVGVGGGGAGSGVERNAPPLRPAQLARAALVLSEINRKMRAVVWSPPDTN